MLYAGGAPGLGILSFNGNKIITSGGGGMLVSRRKEWVEEMLEALSLRTMRAIARAKKRDDEEGGVGVGHLDAQLGQDDRFVDPRDVAGRHFGF